MIVPMAEVLEPELRGQLLGKRHYGRICEVLADAPRGSVALLDFHDVNLVTGSWINAVMVPLLRWAADKQNDLFPVVCNAQDTWLDDLRLVAGFSHQCYLVADRAREPLSRATLVGSLDRGQRITLDAVLELGQVTGAQLERRKPEQNTKPTAWNNRLKDLYVKRLLRREKRGREQVYSPVVREIRLDG